MAQRTDLGAVGARIKKAREDKKLSAIQLSVALGPDAKGRYLSPTTLSRWEAGTQNPERYLTRLCPVLGVSLDWLMYGDAGPPKEEASQAEIDHAQRLLERHGYQVQRAPRPYSGVHEVLSPTVEKRAKREHSRAKTKGSR